MMGCTRIAPTPSGYLHEGNVANFMLVAALARAGGLRIRLRIDDLDRSRFREVYLQDIFDVLLWMGISWDDGPADPTGFLRDYSQLLRLDMYDQMLSELRNRGAVYACRCTRSKGGSGKSFCLADCHALGLSLDDPDFVWICRVDPTFEAGMHDYFGNIQKFGLCELGIGDFVVRRRRESVSARCFPSYQLASVADDVLYGTSLIVRGADLFDSSLRQLWLAHCLDLASFTSVRFVHHKLLLDGGQQKLSKSAGDGRGAAGSLSMKWPSFMDLEAALPVRDWTHDFGIFC